MTISLHNIQPLAQVYSHRDCELNPPLWVSLEHGFTHIEVDVYCMFGNVFVTHDLQQLRPRKTLEKLYLEPLRHYLQKNNGLLFNDKTKLYLFVDTKTPARSSYDSLHQLLQKYKDIVTCFTPEKADDKPVTIVISGNRLPYEVMREQHERYTALDGRLEDLDRHTNPHIMPFISDDWQKHFRWQGFGTMPPDELEKLQSIVHAAHEHNQKLRFWGTPDKANETREYLWTMLLEEGVDLINTNDVKGLKEFLKKHPELANSSAKTG
jgi:hypothetical protein